MLLHCEKYSNTASYFVPVLHESLYRPARVPLVAILKIISASNRYRGTVASIDVHRGRLNGNFGQR